MKAVCLQGYGGTDQMMIGEVPEPVCGDDELLIRVKATALNRADLLQRKGLYPPPQGASEILGLEAAGEVVGLGRSVNGFQQGDRVAVLLSGGGYAEYVCAPASHAIHLPDSLSYEEGAALPEAFLTAYLNLFELGQLRAGQSVLIHAGASGVGSAAIQLAKCSGSHVLVTAGTEEKLGLCMKLGASDGWNYHDGSFKEWVRERTGGAGVDVILDFIGGPYLDDNLHSLCLDGRLVVIGTMGGGKAKMFNLSLLLMKRLQILGTTLRSQSKQRKADLIASFTKQWLPSFLKGEVKVVIDSVWNWKQVQKAHQYMEANQNIGKIVLRLYD